MINGNILPYQLMFPKDYDETKQYPLVVFLHGSGERGDENERQLIHGRDFLRDNFRSNYPAIVLVPQCPKGSSWANIEINVHNNKTEYKFGVSERPTIVMETLMGLINNWISSGKVDKRQVYVGGLSMGGMGTFDILHRMPNTFAAAFPICGAGDTELVPNVVTSTAIWIFHGAKDSVVLPEFSRAMYEALKTKGRDVKYTEYPDLNHNSWSKTFENGELVPWLFSKKRK